MTESFTQKLQQYAPPPPQQVWDAIEARLDEQPMFASRLQQFEATPPQDAWPAIAAQLGGASATPVRKFTWRRFAAAAVLLLLFGSGYYLMQQKPSATTTLTRQGSLLLQPRPRQPLPEARGEATAATTTAGTPGTHAQRLATKTGQRQRFVQPLLPFSFAANAADQENGFIPSYAEKRTEVPIDAKAERYMVYSDGDGNAMRVPRHLFDYISCIRDEINCKRKMAMLRSQMAATTLSTDFTGVLEMLSGLKENQ